MSDIINKDNQGNDIAPFSLGKVRGFSRAMAKELIRDPDFPVVASFEPGNGFRYPIVLTPVPSGVVGNSWLLSLPEAGTCYPIGFEGTFTPEYLIEKRLVSSTRDAMPIAILLNDIAFWVRMAKQHESERRALSARQREELEQFDQTYFDMIEPPLTDAEAAEEWTGLAGA